MRQNDIQDLIMARLIQPRCPEFFDQLPEFTLLMQFQPTHRVFPRTGIQGRNALIIIMLQHWVGNLSINHGRIQMLVSLKAKSSRGDEFFPYGENPTGLTQYATDAGI